MSLSPLALRAEIAALLPRLRRFARTVTGQREDADDLVLSAVARALNHLDQRRDGTRLDGWLFRSMKTAWIDDARTRGRRDDGLALEAADEHVEPSDSDSHDAPPSIEAAMARLPEDQRMAVGLVLVEGLPYAQAADVLEIPVDTLTSHLAQGRRALLMASTPIGDDDRLLLMAYADGAMPEGELIAFEARVALDAALFDALAHERALRASLAGHYDAVLDEPIPDGLLDLLAVPAEQVDDAPAEWPASRAANDSTLAAPPAVVPIRREPAARANAGWSWRAWAGMLASLVVGIFIGGRMLDPAETPAPAIGTAALAVDDQGALTAEGLLRTALEEQPGGPLVGPQGVMIGQSFRDRAQHYCRTFALDTSSGIACKSDGRWLIATFDHATTTTPAASTSAGTYLASASAMNPMLLQAAAGLRDGASLDATGEAAARATGWQR